MYNDKMEFGVFATMAEALDAANKAQKDLVNNYSLEQRDQMISNVRKEFEKINDELSNFEFEETKFGRVEDKIDKNLGGILNTPGTEVIKTRAFATDKGLTIEYSAPYGVVGAVTPSTNPSLTVIGNGISNLAAGNSVVFNAHPFAEKSSAIAVKAFNKAVVDAGGPNNLVTMSANPSLATLQEILESPYVKLLVGTGGPAMVKTLMASGKKVIAAGAGNPPTIVDETADVERAANELYLSTGYDNTLMCTTEKEIFVSDQVLDRFTNAFVESGARLLSEEEANKVRDLIFVELESGEKVVNKDYIGRDASKILSDAGVDVEGDPRVAIFITDKDDLFVQKEQLLPIIPIVPTPNFESAMEWAIEAENNNNHSASIWSKDVYRVTEFGRRINTSIYVQNGGTSAAFGVDGAGKDSPTIATPTGEGITDASTFTRRRLFAMANGGNYIL